MQVPRQWRAYDESSCRECSFRLADRRKATNFISRRFPGHSAVTAHEFSAVAKFRPSLVWHRQRAIAAPSSNHGLTRDSTLPDGVVYPIEPPYHDPGVQLLLKARMKEPPLVGRSFAWQSDSTTRSTPYAGNQLDDAKSGLRRPSRESGQGGSNDGRRRVSAAASRR